MNEELHPELRWPPSDILVSYDEERQQIRYTAISTGLPLMIWDVKAERRVYPSEIIVGNEKQK